MKKNDNGNRRQFPWTAEEDEMMRRLAMEGRSANETSKFLDKVFPHRNRTRDAVLGRARRTGVVFRGGNGTERDLAAAAGVSIAGGSAIMNLMLGADHA